MKHIVALILLVCMAFAAEARSEGDTLGVGTKVVFVANDGQWEGDFQYAAQLHDAALFAEPGALTVAIRTHLSHPSPLSDAPKYHAYKMTFEGSNAVEPVGISQLSYYHNYLLGPTPARWKTRVALYNSVRYDNLYEGIALEIFGAELALKYNFIVSPGANASSLSILYEGTEGVEVTSAGLLRIRTSVRDLMELAPYVYQLDPTGQEKIVKSRWKVTKLKDGDYRAEIVLGPYDKDNELIIDPLLVFSTYTGSIADNWGTTATYDQHKNVYTAGLVFDIGYPTSLGAYQTNYGGGSTDIGIFKFDSTGSQRLYATYLGGSQSDMPHSLIVNSFDELVVFGTTGSDDFPITAGAYQTAFEGGPSINYLSPSLSFPKGSDIFVTRLSSDGATVKASTYVGGTGNDGMNYRNDFNTSYSIVMAGNDSLYKNYGDGARGEIITDNLNNIYIGSTTFSTDFPSTSGCVQPASGGGQDGVVFKLDHNLTTLLWSTYLGGSKGDAVYSIDVDREYNLLVCGGTESNDFPTTTGVFQPTFGGGNTDGFVSKISYAGDKLMTSTYVGKDLYDQIYFVRTGLKDDVFLFGQTSPSGSSWVYNAGYSVYNSGMLLLRLSPGLDSLRWSTVFGTNGRINLSPTAFSVDICDRIYAAGWGRDFVGYNGVSWNTQGTTGMETTTDAYQDETDGQDFYILSISSDAGSLEFGSFFGELHGKNGTWRGSDHVDGGTSRFDRLSTLYQSVCASCGGDNGFPVTSNAWSTDNNADNCNNALFRFNVHSDFPVAEFTLPETGCVPYTIQFQNSGRGSSFYWDFGDGQTSTEESPTHTYVMPGNFTVTLVATLPGGCKTTDTVRHTVQVLTESARTHGTEISCNGTPMQIGVTPTLGATYSWTGDPVSDATVANPWVNQTGTYVLHTTAEGCTQIDTFRVKSFTMVTLCTTNSVSCHDSSDGSLMVYLGANINPDSINVSITPECTIGAVQTGGLANWFKVEGLAPEVPYHLVVQGHGCMYEKDVTLPNPPIPAINKEASPLLCTDSCDGYIRYYYNLNSTQSDTLLSDLCPGTYVTTLVSDGCPVTDTTVIERDHTLDSLYVTVDHNLIYLGESVQLHAGGVNGQATYSWEPAADLDNPASQHPVATPHDTLTCYRVTASTSAGCTASDTVCVHCTEIACGEADLFIPNAFTPNDDGINDRVCFESTVITEFSIAIFNRWGQCVFQSNSIGSCWDGMFRNEKCLPGVYTYTCHFRCAGGKENDFKGDITLIR